MLELLSALPQGLYWYPLVAGLVVITVRTLVGLWGGRREQPEARPHASTQLAGYAHLIRRATSDSYAEAELERLCIGMVLQANGYRGYSVDACRHYTSHGAPPELAAAIEEHLGNAVRLGASRRPPGETRAFAGGPESTLPPRSELILRHLQTMTEEPREHHP